MIKIENKSMFFWNEDQTIVKLKVVLEKDSVAIVSTDTILGFLANLTKCSFYKLNKIKGERERKPYLILISSQEKLSYFVRMNDLTKKMRNLIASCWPGPLTIIFKAKDTLPRFLVSKQGTIALRCPNHEGLLALLKSFDGLFSTSANRGGQIPPSSLVEVESAVLKDVECMVVDKNMSSSEIVPSTILDFSLCGICGESEGNLQENCVRVVREGAYPIDKLEGIYGSKFKR